MPHHGTGRTISKPCSTELGSGWRLDDTRRWMSRYEVGAHYTRGGASSTDLQPCLKGQRSGERASGRGADERSPGRMDAPRHAAFPARNVRRLAGRHHAAERLKCAQWNQKGPDRRAAIDNRQLCIDVLHLNPSDRAAYEFNSQGLEAGPNPTSCLDPGY